MSSTFPHGNVNVAMSTWLLSQQPNGKPMIQHKFIVVTYEIQVFFEGAQKEVFSSIFQKAL